LTITKKLNLAFAAYKLLEQGALKQSYRDLGKLMRVAYDQSSVVRREEPKYMEAVKRRLSGLNKKHFEGGHNLRERKLIFHILENTINKKEAYADEFKRTMNYLENKQAIKKDDDIKRPITFQQELYLRQQMKCCEDENLLHIYRKIFPIDKAQAKSHIKDNDEGTKYDDSKPNEIGMSGRINRMLDVDVLRLPKFKFPTTIKD